MKKATYSLSAIGIVVVAITLIFFRSPSSPYPPWDRSSEYRYQIKNGGVYLQVVRHDEYIYITQYGVWYSDSPSLVKRSSEHNSVLGLRDIKSKEEFEKARLAFVVWEESYNSNEKNRIDLSAAEKSFTVPAGTNPYDWRPNDVLPSFREYYTTNKESRFLESDFYDKNYYL